MSTQRLKVIIQKLTVCFVHKNTITMGQESSLEQKGL